MGPKIGVGFVVLAAASGAGWWGTTTYASDHDEAPLVKADASMDITDLYVFESATGKTTIIVCWAGFNDSRPQPDTEGVYNPDALYTIHIDNDGDNVADHLIYWRYGEDEEGQIGVQFDGIPGVDGAVEGAIETVHDAGGGARVWSGRAEDPFFFDAVGYLNTLATGNLSFTCLDPNGTCDSGDDFLAGLNVTAAAIEIDTASMQEGNNPVQVWTTSGRLP